MDGLVCLNFGWDALAALQERTRVPIVHHHEATRLGLVAGFGAISSIDEQFRIAARVLRGEKPATIPAEHPERWYLAINMKAARALGVTVPNSLLARADEILK